MDIIIGLSYLFTILIPILGLLLIGLIQQNRKRRIILHNIWIIERTLRAKKQRRY